MTDDVRALDVSVVVGDQVVLAPTTFVVRAGTSLAVTGPSGSGKSTLLSCISGRREVTSGSVQVGDREISGLGEGARGRWRRDYVGVVEQEPHLLEELSVQENVELVLGFRGERIGGSRTRQVMEALGIDGLARRSVLDLSGGERQRVAVARALVNARSVLVADEPTASLDRTAADVVAHHLIEVASVLGAPLILATHDPLVASRCDAELDLGTSR